CARTGNFWTCSNERSAQAEKAVAGRERGVSRDAQARAANLQDLLAADEEAADGGEHLHAARAERAAAAARGVWRPAALDVEAAEHTAVLRLAELSAFQSDHP